MIITCIIANKTKIYQRLLKRLLNCCLMFSNCVGQTRFQIISWNNKIIFVFALQFFLMQNIAFV